MSEFEKIKVAVNQSEYENTLSIYEGRIEFYQNTIDKIKSIVPDFVFATSDLTPLFSDPKGYLLEKLVPEPLTIGGLQLDKDKVFDLLGNSDQLKSVITYIDGLNKQTLPLYMYSKNYEINETQEVELKQSAVNSLLEQNSIFIKSQKQKTAYDSLVKIKEEIDKINTTYGLHPDKILGEYIVVTYGGQTEINYKALHRLG